MSEKPPQLRKVKCSQIEITDLQARAETCEVTILEYAEQWKLGAKFPPVTVFHDGKVYFLADGIHRYMSAGEADLKEIACEVHEGTRSDALWFSAGANKSHGLKRTQADKQKAVEIALKLKPKLADRTIATHCGVSHPNVAKVRKELIQLEILPVDGGKREGLDGKEYKQPKKNQVVILPPEPPTESPAEQPAALPVPPVPQPASEPARVQTRQPAAKDERDNEGRIIPRLILTAWHGSEWASEHLQTLKRMLCQLREIREIAEPQGGIRKYSQCSFGALEAAIANARAELIGAIPHAVCLSCQGQTPDSCNRCKGWGFITIAQWHQAKPEEKALHPSPK